MNRFSHVLLTASLAVSLIGCGGGSNDELGTVSVSGKVTLNGAPVMNAKVYFMSEDFSSSGLTNADGEYTLVKGAKPGANKVYITKIEGDGSVDPEIAGDAGQLEAMGGTTTGGKTKAATEAIPAQYSDPTNTTLTFDVPADGSSEANFDL